MFQLEISKSHLAEFVDATERQFKTPFKKGLFTTTWNALSKAANGEVDSTVTFFRGRSEIPTVIGKKPQVTLFDGPYEYRSGEYYGIFANSRLGGGYLNRGFVQEEIIMMESPELSVLVSNFNVLGPLDEREVAIYKNIDRAGAISIYGNKEVDQFERTGKDFKQIFDKKQACPSVNYLALDAVNVSQKTKASKADIKYMLDKATSGFCLAKKHGAETIHFGKWGAGVYGNDLRTIFIITLLAAWKAGIDVNFYLYDGNGRRDIHPILEKFESASYEELEKML